MCIRDSPSMFTGILRPTDPIAPHPHSGLPLEAEGDCVWLTLIANQGDFWLGKLAAIG